MDRSERDAMTMDRRRFMQLAGACLGGMATTVVPRFAFADVPDMRRRLVFVLLRGGFDGLAAVAPTFDPGYRATRGALAADPSELIGLNDGFALTPGLSPLAEFWKRDELVVLHALAIPFRTRSHFDGQAVLETGLDRPKGDSDGWLNRLLSVMGGTNKGISVAAGMPLSLTGTVPVSSWAPVEVENIDVGLMDRLHVLYRMDPKLANSFEAALQQTGLGIEVGNVQNMRGGARRGSVDGLFQAAAKLLRSDNGPNIAAMEMSGWDTHVNQGVVGGYLDLLLSRLADGLTAFREAMGEQWPGTTVVVMTEFGRTAKPNGSNGTDHGTAGVGFVLADGIGKSKIVTEWPGLGERELHEGRDLMPTMDTRAALKGVLAGTFELTPGQINRVFPGSGAQAAIDRIWA